MYQKNKPGPKPTNPQPCLGELRKPIPCCGWVLDVIHDLDQVHHLV